MSNTEDLLNAQLERLEIEQITLRVLAEQLEDLSKKLAEFENQLKKGSFDE